MIKTATMEIRMVVYQRLTNTPISFLRVVKRISGMIAKGNPKLSTTWLITRVQATYDYRQGGHHRHQAANPNRDVLV